MILKLFGAAMLLASGGFYARLASSEAARELEESLYALELFRFIRNEIADYGAPLDEILGEKGIHGGIKGLNALFSENLQAEISEASGLGRGFGNEEIRICDKLIARLEGRTKRLGDRLGEVRTLSRVKGIGLSAVLVILLV